MTTARILRRLAPLLWLVLGAHLFAACAHSTRVESVPSGAAVYVEDEYVGETPLELKSSGGPIGHERVEVRYEGEAARFDMMREGWSGLGLVGAAAVGMGTFALGTASVIGFASLYATTVLASLSGANDALSVGLLTATSIAAVFMYAGGYLLMLLAPQFALLTAGETGRKNAERVVVNFKRGALTSQPPSLVVPLVGASSGYRPLRLHEDEAE